MRQQRLDRCSVGQSSRRCGCSVRLNCCCRQRELRRSLISCAGATSGSLAHTECSDENCHGGLPSIRCVRACDGVVRRSCCAIGCGTGLAGCVDDCRGLVIRCVGGLLLQKFHGVSDCVGGMHKSLCGSSRPFRTPSGNGTRCSTLLRNCRFHCQPTPGRIATVVGCPGLPFTAVTQTHTTQRRPPQLKRFRVRRRLRLVKIVSENVRQIACSSRAGSFPSLSMRCSRNRMFRRRTDLGRTAFWPVLAVRRQASDSFWISLGVPNSCPKVSVRSASAHCRTSRLRQQVVSERWRRRLAADCRMRVNVNASPGPQILQILLFAPADKPLREAYY